MPIIVVYIDMNNDTYISLADDLRHVAVAEAEKHIFTAEDVEDIVQEVMLRVWEKHTMLLPERKMLYAYVAKLARNICLDRKKQKRRHPILRLVWRKKHDEEYEYEVPSYDTPHQCLEHKEATKLYSEAVRKLPYTWRMILQMRCEQEKSYAEIAKILGTSDSSVRAMLCKAKKKVLQLVNKNL